MNNDWNKIAEESVKAAGLHSINIKNRDGVEKTYTIKLMPARKAAVIGTELLKLVGPAIGAWIDSEGRKEFVLPEEESVFTEVTMLLVRQMENFSVLNVIDALTEGTTCSGQPVDIDNEFRGNVGALVKLVKFSLESNIGPFGDWPEMLGLSLKTPSEASKKLEETSK